MGKNIRRVVTRCTKKGTSELVSDGAPTQIVNLEDFPELEIINLWATEDLPIIPVDRNDPTLETSSFLPNPGSTRFRIVRISPTDTHDGEDNGLHSSNTVEYSIICSGEVWLKLDDGTEIHLRSGDCMIQNGTRHALANRGTETCVIAFVLIGAQHHSIF